MDLVRALQLQAIGAVLRPDAESRLRYIFRWYSKRFHTPLHEVSSLPTVDILLAFYEERYEEMEEDTLEEERVRLCETAAEQVIREAAEDYAAAEEAQFIAQVEAEANAVDNQILATASTNAPPSIAKEEPLISMNFLDADAFAKLTDP